MEGTEEKQDVITSADSKETSETETETFTKKDVDEAERKGRSNGASEMGRLTKLNTDLIKSSQAIQARLEKRDRDDEERERERYRDEPDKLTAIDERVKRRGVETELADVRQELSEKNERLQEAERKESESTKERNAREIATRLNVDPKLLVRLSKLTDGSSEAIEVEAQGLPKLSETKTLLADSGKTIGGDANFVKIRDEMIKNPSDDAKMKRYMEAKKARGG